MSEIKYNSRMDVRSLQLQHQIGVERNRTGSSEKTGAESFAGILENKFNTENEVKFSRHARERLNQRGIDVTQGLLDDINAAVEKAREKGAKDTVIIGAQGVFLVNVPNNTVITTVSHQEMKDNIFTNIDSAVII